MTETQLSPFSPDRIFCNMRIRSEYDHAARNCLAYEDPVKGVFVVVGKTRKLKHCLFIQRKGIDIVAASPLFYKFVGWIRQRQFAQFVFNDYFPCGSNAQINLIRRIGEKLAGLAGQIRAAGDYPQKSAGVQKNIHYSSPWKRASVSSGNSSKNESGRLNLPLAKPIGRGLSRCAGSGLISATGWFRLHRRIVSPCSTSSRYRERWVLASWMFIFFMTIY